MKTVFAVLLLLTILTLTSAACGNGTMSNHTGGASGVPTVHMDDQDFAQSSITISKGSTLTLVDDTGTPHIIADGSWANGSPEPMQEHGMPLVNNIQVSGSGSSQIVGPFTTSGTFHLYCLVHPGMSLTVIVQ